jgi:hypothetical protein
MERVKKHRNFLHRLLRVKGDRHQRDQHIQQANTAEICTICEVVKNLLRNPTLNVQPTPLQRQILKAHKREIGELIDRSVPVERKRHILLRRRRQQKQGGSQQKTSRRGGAGAKQQCGKGFPLLPLLISLAAPVLQRVIGT